MDVNGNTTHMERSDSGTMQGSVLGLIIFSLFIRPIYDVENLTTYADDNYISRIGFDLEQVLDETKKAIKRWLKDSGLKVKKRKTELCFL